MRIERASELGVRNFPSLSWTIELDGLDYVEDSMIVDIEGLETLDGNPAKIVLHQPIDMISGALAPVLPDTSIEENIGIGNVPVPIPFRLITLLSFKKMNFHHQPWWYSWMYLREVVVSSGEMVFAVESSIEGELDMSYYFDLLHY